MARLAVPRLDRIGPWKYKLVGNGNNEAILVRAVAFDADFSAFHPLLDQERALILVEPTGGISIAQRLLVFNFIDASASRPSSDLQRNGIAKLLSRQLCLRQRFHLRDARRRG